MRWNPYLNALLATTYICAVALLFRFISAGHANTPDTLLDPILALSLLVFSVATMGFLFFYRPLLLVLDNKKEQAVSYFARTLITFGVLTLVVFLVYNVL